MVAHGPRDRSAHRRVVAALVLAAAACAPKSVVTTRAPVETSAIEGLASFYGDGFDGKLTASGEKFDRGAFTAAHRTFPFGACVRVTVIESGKSVEVRVNDRGPFVAGRIIDVSEAAARQLGLIEKGVAAVKLERCD